MVWLANSIATSRRRNQNGLSAQGLEADSISFLASIFWYLGLGFTSSGVTGVTGVSSVNPTHCHMLIEW